MSIFTKISPYLYFCVKGFSSTCHFANMYTYVYSTLKGTDTATTPESGIKNHRILKKHGNNQFAVRQSRNSPKQHPQHRFESWCQFQGVHRYRASGWQMQSDSSVEVKLPNNGRGRQYSSPGRTKTL